MSIRSEYESVRRRADRLAREREVRFPGTPLQGAVRAENAELMVVVGLLAVSVVGVVFVAVLGGLSAWQTALLVLGSLSIGVLFPASAGSFPNLPSLVALAMVVAIMVVCGWTSPIPNVVSGLWLGASASALLVSVVATRAASRRIRGGADFRP